MNWKKKQGRERERGRRVERKREKTVTTDLDLLQSYRNCCRSCCRLLEPYKTKILKSTTKCRKLGRNDFGLRVRSFVINVFRTFRCIRSFIPFSPPFLPSPTLSSSISLSLCLPRRMCILLHVKTESVTRSAWLIHATRVTSFYVSYSPLLFLFFFGSWERGRGVSSTVSFQLGENSSMLLLAARGQCSVVYQLADFYKIGIRSCQTRLKHAARIPLVEFVVNISFYPRISPLRKFKC